ncbi:pyridine nucleotide-disulfide oxidoreductase domain-containing protein 1-like, partial [Actinia tenebrosa]|uniref:Pyridine nucleotide-disulfide oxidoreductase domain-containing protein 1 n=1 Tax=Actinia tenebrosa TaxID=6105 RepID=A0A6P8HU71_ACTTE
HLNLLCPDKKVTLITATDLVKAVVNLNQYGRYIEDFDVEEKSVDSFSSGLSNLTVVKGKVKDFNPEDHYVTTSDGRVYEYEKLLISTGGSPRLIDDSNPHVIGIRDTHSVQYFKTRLADARRVAVIGNGGIAMELVFELTGHEVLWAIKHDSIGNHYFDKGAASFLLSHLESTNTPRPKEPVIKRMKYGRIVGKELSPASLEDKSLSEGGVIGGALGPDWSQGLSLHSDSTEDSYRNIHIEYKCEVEKILTPQNLLDQNFEETPFPRNKCLYEESTQWPVYVKLTNGKIYGCDVVVSATGVTTNTAPFISNAPFDIATDGGIKVDDNMRSSIPDVYAAGDVCTTSWEPSKLWFQMRLWTQARPMGAFAAHCMSDNLKGQQVPLDFCFELFTHVTKFFGFKVVLLGKYNAQGLGNDYQLLFRCTKGVEFVKVVMQNGRMVGAVLIGETGLEETFENLILNEIDLSGFEDSLLDSRVDIEDFFD